MGGGQITFWGGDFQSTHSLSITHNYLAVLGDHSVGQKKRKSWQFNFFLKSVFLFRWWLTAAAAAAAVWHRQWRRKHWESLSVNHCGQTTGGLTGDTFAWLPSADQYHNQQRMLPLSMIGPKIFRQKEKRESQQTEQLQCVIWVWKPGANIRKH